jgi:hypothetical protein
MKRSKIDVTDELRCLGVWEAASWWKDRRKQQLINGGLTRREANSKAWDEMEEHFEETNLKRHAINQLVTMSDFAPILDTAIVDEPNEVDLATVWRFWCLCLARLESWEIEDFDTASMITCQMSAAIQDNNAPALSMALDEVNRFVKEIVAIKFNAVIHRLGAFSGEYSEYISELQSHIREMRRFGVVA